MVRTLSNAFETGPHPAGLDPHRRARRRQDHDRAHSRPRAQLRTARRLGAPARPSTCRCSASTARPSWRAAISTCIEMDAASHNGVDDVRQINDAIRYAPVSRAVQGLHPRRSAHALGGGLQRAAQDPGRTAAAREVHLRDHRNPQGADHDPVALPALRPAPRRCRSCWSKHLASIAGKEGDRRSSRRRWR